MNLYRLGAYEIQMLKLRLIFFCINSAGSFFRDKQINYVNKVFKAKQSRKEFLRAKQTFRNFFFAEVLFLYVEIKFTNYFTVSVVKPF